MIIVAILLIIAAVAFFAWQLQLARADMLAAEVHLAQIEAQNRLDVIDHLWPYAILFFVLALVVVAAVVYLKRPGPIVDRRQIILLPPGESKREFYKALRQHDAILLPKKDRRKITERRQA